MLGFQPPSVASIHNLPDVAHLAIDILPALLLLHLEASKQRRVPKKMESIPKKIKLHIGKGRLLHSFTKGRLRRINDMKESSTFSTSWQSSIFSDQLQLRMDMPCYPPKPAMCCSNRQILPSNCEATFWNYWLAYRYRHTVGMKNGNDQ